MTKTNLVGVLLAALVVVGIATGTETAYAKSASEIANTGTVVTPVVEVTTVAKENRIKRMGPAKTTKSQPNKWMDSGHAVWQSAPKWIRDLGLCIRKHESIRSGHYNAENPISTASGAYQYLDGTWVGNNKFTKVNGKRVPQYAHASSAPKWVQDAVFIHTIKHGGIKAWHGTHCSGT